MDPPPRQLSKDVRRVHSHLIFDAEHRGAQRRKIAPMTSKQTDAALEASAAELGLQGTKMADLEAEAAAAAAAAAPKEEYASSRQGDAALEASAQSLRARTNRTTT